MHLDLRNMSSEQRFKLSPELNLMVHPRIIGISEMDAHSIIGYLEMMRDFKRFNADSGTKEILNEIIDAVTEELEKHGE